MRIIRSLAAALTIMAAGEAAATQEYLLPTLFDVTGVAEGDVLNIRSGPGVGHPIIGRLDHDARGIEIVAHGAGGAWGQVILDESPGWVAMRFLSYRTDVWEPRALPEDLQCLGTEPFWSVTHERSRLVLERPEDPAWAAQVTAILDSGIFRDPRRAVIATEGGTRMTATLDTRTCSDGMSDRVYGLSAMVVLESGGEPVLLTGCCRLAP
jgi:uncharacterized membrane protein